MFLYLDTLCLNTLLLNAQKVQNFEIDNVYSKKLNEKICQCVFVFDLDVSVNIANRVLYHSVSF